MSDPTTANESFETRRWNRQDVRVFAAMDTMPQIAERVLSVVGEGRVMNKTATYVQRDGLRDLSNLDHATGLQKGGHAGHPDGHNVWHSEDQAGFGVFLTHESGTLGTLEGFGVGVMAYNAATEKQVKARYDKGRNASSHFDERRDITYVEIHGRPENPRRDDRIEIMDWNEHGVLRHTIITFVEPGWCDSGRVTETNYVILGHRVDPDRKPYSEREEDAEVFTRFPGPVTSDDLEQARAQVREIASRSDVAYAWLAEEKVTRERRSI